MLLEHEGEYGLGMDIMVTLCSWSGTRKRLWFGHGCRVNRMLLEHEGDYGLGMDVMVTVCSWSGTRDYGLGMDVKVIVCSWSTKEILVWAWM